MESIQSNIDVFLNKHPILTMEQMLEHELSDPKQQDPIWSLCKMENNEFPFPPKLIQLFLYVRNLHQVLFNTIEGKEGCTKKNWSATEHHAEKKLNGGGVMTVIREEILEKSAVNMSVVYGPKYPALEGEYAGKPFVAAGVSLISHPKNPNAPIVHLNVRCLKVNDNGKSVQWIGGGADLTPMVSFAEDTALFHSHMKKSCENNPTVGNYEKYTKWADEYFYLPHRKSIRGVGGIFFDFVPLEQEEQWSYLLDVGQYNAHAYAKIMAQRASMPYDDNLKEQHLYWRGRYAEFNLAYDRGTRFGLMTGGNTEAILCSLPPTVKW